MILDFGIFSYLQGEWQGWDSQRKRCPYCELRVRNQWDSLQAQLTTKWEGETNGQWSCKYVTVTVDTEILQIQYLLFSSLGLQVRYCWFEERVGPQQEELWQGENEECRSGDPIDNSGPGHEVQNTVAGDWTSRGEK